MNARLQFLTAALDGLSPDDMRKVLARLAGLDPAAFAIAMDAAS